MPIVVTTLAGERTDATAPCLDIVDNFFTVGPRHIRPDWPQIRPIQPAGRTKPCSWWPRRAARGIDSWHLMKVVVVDSSNWPPLFLHVVCAKLASRPHEKKEQSRGSQSEGNAEGQERKDYRPVQLG